MAQKKSLMDEWIDEQKKIAIANLAKREEQMESRVNPQSELARKLEKQHQEWREQKRKRRTPKEILAKTEENREKIKTLDPADKLMLALTFLTDALPPWDYGQWEWAQNFVSDWMDTNEFECYIAQFREQTKG